MSLNTTTDKKASHSLPSIMDQLLSDSLFPPRRQSELKTEKEDDSDSNDDDKPDDSGSRKKDPLASKIWRMYTKAKDTLPNGSRMENLTWRMMAMTLTKKKLSEEAAAKAAESSNNADTTSLCAMDVDQPTNRCNPTTPPAADDTTGLLSSSAPPYTMIDLFNKKNDQQQKQKQLDQQKQYQLRLQQKQHQPNHQQHYNDNRNNVLVSGSMRAINTSDHVPQFTVSFT